MIANTLPTVDIEGHHISRLVIGTNWFLGYSHQSAAKSRWIRRYQTAERIATLIERAGLPTRLPQALNPEEVAQACRLDKKVRGGVVNFVLLKGLGLPARIADVSDEEIAAALRVVQPR